MKNIFDTKTVIFQELIGNGKKYRIPEFQRDFSWKEENWEDLWQDLIDIYENKETQHYMGAIVLQNTQEKKNIYCCRWTAKNNYSFFVYIGDY